tara:strand:- start:248 stop:1180 length:933 start_codon:yes stop_codon:yes gene_type:complete
MQEKITYKTSGVDIEAGNAFVERLKEKVPTIGGFGGMYKVPRGYEEPILVSGSDGVGTKICICSRLDNYKTIGIDLVAMCVNDIITCGAKPLYFLDYISLNRITPKLDDIMSGIIKGCELAGVELIGGETAEHPMSFDIDLAGFSTGIVEEYDIVDGKLIKEGDIIIGVESSGVHSNGYSLINHLIRQKKIKATRDLLTPTYIYTSLVEQLMNEVPVLGMANITGGGIPENLPRCLPKGLRPHVDYNSWELPNVFKRIMISGEIPEEEMKKVFNLGIGYCVVIPKEAEYDAHDTIKSVGYKSWTIGEVVL